MLAEIGILYMAMNMVSQYLLEFLHYRNNFVAECYAHALLTLSVHVDLRIVILI